MTRTSEMGMTSLFGSDESEFCQSPADAFAQNFFWLIWHAGEDQGVSAGGLVGCHLRWEGPHIMEC